MRSRIAVLAVTLAIAATACGARLTEEQRLAGIGAGPGGATTTGPTVGPTGAATTGPTVGPNTTTGPTTGPSTGPTSGPAACASNGEATDVGVTADQITIATASDVTGVQPGLFRSTWQGVEAAAAYINSIGGVCGRQIKTTQIDTKTNSTGNREAVLQACDKAFALVGSMSAFDDGGARAVDECKIPDLTAITTNPARNNNEYTYPIYPNRSDYTVPAGAYIKKKYPGVIRNAAMLYLNQAVTKLNADARVQAYEGDLGFDFIYGRAVQVFETNYSSIVVDMKNHDPPIEYVSMVADNASIARLTKAMRQQNWYPEVLDFDSVVYGPQFITNAEGSAEGLHFFINTAMLEEAATNPEMQLYQTWLQRVSPGAVPDYFGIYAWSATRLFADLAAKVGPDLTRPKLMERIKATNSWGGFGMHAPHDIGKRLASECYLYALVRGTSFVREHPNKGWDCSYGRLIKN